MKIPVNKVWSTSLIITIYSFQLISGQSEGKETRDSIRYAKKDILDIFQSITNRQLRKNTIQSGGKGLSFFIIPSFNYSIHTGLTGIITTGATFNPDPERGKMSKIITNWNYSQFHQYWITTTSNIFLDKPELHFFSDFRYYKFPTQTYGLGPQSTMSHPLQIDYSYLRLYQLVFREIAANLFIGMGYNLDYHWNIKVDTVIGNKLDQFVRYQQGNHSISSGVSLNILYDNRRNVINPRNGTLVNIQIRPNMRFLGSDKNWNSVSMEFRHYLKFPVSSDNILAIWSYNEITISGTPPYLDLPSIGWDDYSATGRGYAIGRYTGRDLIYIESEYRFSLTKNGLLGAVIFGNAESIPESPSSDLGPLIPGGGFGLRIKVNKFSDTNLCIDYGFGVRGSRGFFLNLGEVF